MLVEINCQPTPFNPPELNRHSATLINNKLYIFGGNNLSETTNEFFYLDVSAPFDTQNLAWQDLANITNINSLLETGHEIIILFHHAEGEHYTLIDEIQPHNKYRIINYAFDQPIKVIDLRELKSM